MRKIETYIVDSFTDEPFKGNPAGVCLLENELLESEMLAIAKELGFSETAFVIPLSDADRYAIRYFSPVMEIPLCGHATLASSKVILEKTGKSNITFVNINDLNLVIRQDGESIVMEFPIYDTVPQEVPTKLLQALGIKEVNNSVYNKETNILMLEINDASILRKLIPDFNKLIDSHDKINGVLITAISSDPSYDFESRYFWPWSGTNEDPVTGGTHTFLAKYWSTRLGKTKMNSYQCSERTGFMEVELLDKDKMTIKSTARIVLKGELSL